MVVGTGWYLEALDGELGLVGLVEAAGNGRRAAR